MQRKFITNLAFLLILNLLIKPFWVLGVDRAVQNAVGSVNYGFYFSLFNFSLLFNILLDCGITNFNNKNISQNNHLLNKHLSSIIVLRLLLALVYISVTLLVGLIIGYSNYQLWLLSILCFNQFLLYFILYLRSNIAGLHFFKTDSFISVLDRLMMICLCAFIIWGPAKAIGFKIEWYIYVQTIAYFIAAIITLAIVIDKAKLKKLNVSKIFFMMILKKSYLYAVLVLLMTFYNRIDSVMLERLLPDGSKQSGIYASAYRLLDAANMIAYLFAGLLLPIFSKMLKHKEPVEELTRLAFCLLVVPAMAIATTSFFYKQELMKLLYREHIEGAALAFGLLMICFIPVACTYIFGTLLTANGSLKQLNLIATGGMLINFTLDLALIPQYKVLGAVFASLSAQLITAIAQVWLASYKFKFHINKRFISAVFTYVLLIILVNASAHLLHVSWMLQLLLAVGGCITAAFALRLISIKQLVGIVKLG